jgi:hypothetical protein
MSRKVPLFAALLLLAALTLPNPGSASVYQTVDLSTGVDVGTLGNPLYPNGGRDDYWRVRSVPGATYSNSIQSWVISFVGGWNTIPGSMPIFGNNTGVGTSEYERCFCLQSTEKAALTLSLRADNKANLFLNSYFANPVMQVLANNTFNPSVPAVQRTYTAQDGLKVGRNCIRVRVNNEGGPTGFALKATLQGFGAQDTAGEPCCRQGAGVFTEALRTTAAELDPQPDNRAAPALELSPGRVTRAGPND